MESKGDCPFCLIPGHVVVVATAFSTAYECRACGRQFVSADEARMEEELLTLHTEAECNKMS